MSSRGTPAWAKGKFHDYDSCVRWYLSGKP